MKNKLNLRPLASKEVKEIKKFLKSQWGFEGELDFQFLISSKDKIYIANREITKIDFSKFRINNIGLYFAEQKGEFRLSIEGSQIIGPHATKNVLELTYEQMKLWMSGQDLGNIDEKSCGVLFSGFIILKYQNDFLGTGKFKDNTILNFVSKARRLNGTDLP